MNGSATTDQRPITEQPGTVIGAYKLLQQIGEGGMGVVFMAEQSDPIQRTVALTTSPASMLTAPVQEELAAVISRMPAPSFVRSPSAGHIDEHALQPEGLPLFNSRLNLGTFIT